MATRKAQIPVGVVLQDDDARLLAELVHRLALFQGEGDAGGVLEIGDEVEHPGLGIFPDSGLQLFDGDAVLLHIHPHQPRPAGAEGVEGADKGGILTEDHIPLVHQALGGQLDGLLRPGGDDDAVPRLGKARLPAVGELTRRLLEGRVPFGEGVLQGRHRLVFKDDAADVFQLLDGEGVGGRVAAGKGDHRRIGHVFKDLPNGGGLHGGHPVRDFQLHNNTCFAQYIVHLPGELLFIIIANFRRLEKSFLPQKLEDTPRGAAKPGKKAGNPSKKAAFALDFPGRVCYSKNTSRRGFFFCALQRT